MTKRVTRRVIIVLVVVVSMLALIFAADRGVQALAERRAAGEIQRSLGADQPPSVDLGPWPFLTEIATGRIATARVRTPRAELPDTNDAVVNDVDATFTDVTFARGFTNAVARHGRATGLLPYPALSELSGLQLSYAAPDRLAVAFSVPIGRLTINGTATGRPVLDEAAQTLTIEDAEVTVPGAEGDPGILDAVGRLVLRRPVPLAELPYDLRVTELTVTEAGVRFEATGENIPLQGQ